MVIEFLAYGQLTTMVKKATVSDLKLAHYVINHAVQTMQMS